MPGLSLSPQVLALLDAGEIVVLPNRRAVSNLRARFDQRQRERGLLDWEPPVVLAWSDWTDDLWSTAVLEGTEERLLLNHVQEEALWVEIMGRQPGKGAPAPGQLQQLASLARSGLALAADYLAVDRLRRAADSFDAKMFAQWVEALLATCRDRQMLPHALGQAAVAGHLRSGALRVPEAVHLFGHEHLLPGQIAVLDAVRDRGGAITSQRFAHDPLDGLRYAATASDPAEELRLGVRWIRQFFSAPAPAGRTVALILPDANAERPQLDRLLREFLAPELECVSADLSSVPWQFSRETALGAVPVLAHAMEVPRWLAGALPIERVRQLLLSPFFQHSDTLEARARFEMEDLRHAAVFKPELTLPEVLRAAQARRKRPADEALRLMEWNAVQAFAAVHRLTKNTLSFADWTDRLRGLLSRAGWPGSRTLSPAEFRATEAWESVLDLLATLDVHGRRVDLSTMLGTLERQLAEAPLPHTEDYAPVQIMSLGEAVGSSFDAVLLLRATDETLPAPEHLHPLLGSGLQRSLRLPGTDAAATHAEVRDQLRSLAERSGTVLLSAAANDSRGPLRLTPLARELRFVHKQSTELVPPEAAADPVQQIVLAERPLPGIPSPRIEGGAAVLEAQAACGFRAFAGMRLRAAAPEGRTLGLNARETGSVLHRALEHFWREVGSQDQLRSMPDAEQHAAVRAAVVHAFGRYQLPNPDGWSAAYLCVLQRRFEQLLGRWLELELDRAPFTVLAQEAEQAIAIGPLELQIRLDRVDQVEGGYVLVDYKTSSALSTKDWMGERPDSPQLPLYALLGEPEEVRGLAFARVRRGKDMGWLSMADDAGMFPRKGSNRVEDFVSQIGLWQTELERLARAFAEGRTEVNPKAYPGTCKHCAQRLLCRLSPETLLAQGTGVGTEDAEVVIEG